jgi:hypothetical protein
MTEAADVIAVDRVPCQQCPGEAFNASPRAAIGDLLLNQHGLICQGSGPRSSQPLWSILSNQVREAFPTVFEPRHPRVESRDP